MRDTRARTALLSGGTATFVAIVVVATAYILSARLGLALAVTNRNVTVVWPPTGIAVAALLTFGLRVWPGVAIGAFVGNVLNAASPATAAAITVGNTVAPIVGAVLLRHVFRIRRSLERVGDVLGLFLVGGFAAMTISATAGVAALSVTGAIGDAPLVRTWLLWWVGDAAGVVIFAPFLLLLGRLLRRNPLTAHPFEAAGLLVATVSLTYLVFNVPLTLPYLVFIPIVWAALRFERYGAVCVSLVITVLALEETLSGRGPFSLMGQPENLVSLQLFNASVAFTSMVLACVMRERSRAELALRSSEERYRKLFEQASDLVCIYDRDGNLTYVNAAAAWVTGFTVERLRAMNISDLVAPEDLRVVRRTTTRQLAGKTDATTYEVDIVGTSGRRVALEISTTAVHEDGQAVAIQFIGRDITSRRIAEDRLRQEALHDQVTGLPNRTLLRERLEFAIALARRNRTPFVLALLDLDRFHEVNDAHDHRAGDLVLRQVGARLREAFIEPDTVARVSGDEFAVLVPSLAVGKDATIIGEQLNAELEAPFVVSQAQISLSASVGIALFPQHGDDADTMMQRADYAMFAAKQDGGASYRVYSPDHDSTGARRVALLDELHAAVTERSFVLYYQPKIDVSTMATVGVEALLRWSHPRLGLVLPVEFLPLAEEAGVMPSLTSWVLEESVRQLAVWTNAGMDLTMSVNLSASSLRNGDIVDTTRRLLAEHKIPSERLTLEMRESDVLDESLHPVLRRLDAEGVRLSIDDFGTASSSMVNLRRLPFDEIKVDRSFVTSMAANGDDREIARSIIELGHNIGAQVVAEGVESRDVWGHLLDMGCDVAQGFLICRPVPADELESWLHTPSWTARVH